jgi:hypothetical protein
MNHCHKNNSVDIVKKYFDAQKIYSEQLKLKVNANPKTTHKFLDYFDLEHRPVFFNCLSRLFCLGERLHC